MTTDMESWACMCMRLNPGEGGRQIESVRVSECVLMCVPLLENATQYQWKDKDIVEIP